MVGFSGTVMGPDSHTGGSRSHDRVRGSHDHDRVRGSLRQGQRKPQLGQAGAQRASRWKGVSEEF